MSSSSQDLIKKSITKLKSKSLVKNSPSDLALLEEMDLNYQSLQEEVKAKNLKNLALSDIITLRKTYAKNILIFMIVWAVITLLCFLGSSFQNSVFVVKESTMNILIGTSFGNVLALAGVVAKGLFIDYK